MTAARALCRPILWSSTKCDAGLPSFALPLRRAFAGSIREGRATLSLTANLGLDIPYYVLQNPYINNANGVAAMTKQEIEVLQNIIARLKKPNCGCSNSPGFDSLVADANAYGLEVASRLYLDTWVVPSLEMLLPESRDPALAVRMSRS